MICRVFEESVSWSDVAAFYGSEKLCHEESALHARVEVQRLLTTLGHITEGSSDGPNSPVPGYPIGRNRLKPPSCHQCIWFTADLLLKLEDFLLACRKMHAQGSL